MRAFTFILDCIEFVEFSKTRISNAIFIFCFPFLLHVFLIRIRLQRYKKMLITRQFINKITVFSSKNIRKSRVERYRGVNLKFKNYEKNINSKNNHSSTTTLYQSGTLEKIYRNTNQTKSGKHLHGIASLKLRLLNSTLHLKRSFMKS